MMIILEVKAYRYTYTHIDTYTHTIPHSELLSCRDICGVPVDYTSPVVWVIHNQGDQALKTGKR